MTRTRTFLWLLVATLAAAGASARAQIKMVYIDPLSGMMAATGDHGLRELRFAADRINERGRDPGAEDRDRGDGQQALAPGDAGRCSTARWTKASTTSSRATARAWPAPHRRDQEEQRAQSRQAGPLPQLRGDRSRLHQLQVQLLALPLRRQRRQKLHALDQLHGEAEGASRRSTSSARTTSSGSRSRRRPRSWSSEASRTRRSSATSCTRSPR